MIKRENVRIEVKEERGLKDAEQCEPFLVKKKINTLLEKTDRQGMEGLDCTGQDGRGHGRSGHNRRTPLMWQQLTTNWQRTENTGRLNILEQKSR